MHKHARITALISVCASIVLFGIGAVAILTIPGLGVEAQILLPVVVLVGLLFAPYVAERLSLRYTSGDRDSDH